MTTNCLCLWLVCLAITITTTIAVTPIQKVVSRDAFGVDLPNWLDQSHVNLTNVLERHPWWLCPNGTQYMVKPSYPDFFHQVFGCCPTDQRGCMLPGHQAVLGCCPFDQQCAFRSTGINGLVTPNTFETLKFMGCIQGDQAVEYCYDKLCGPEDTYRCCRTTTRRGSGRCLPMTDDDRADVAGGQSANTTCGASKTFKPTNIGDTREFTVHLPYANWTDGVWIFPNSGIDFGLEFGVNGTQTYAGLDPPIRICGGTLAKCHLTDTCFLDTWWDDRQNLTVTDETYCCPSNTTTGESVDYEWDLCVWPDLRELIVLNGSVPEDVAAPNGPPAYVGCASEAIGQSCCGTSICAPENKCCRVRYYTQIPARIAEARGHPELTEPEELTINATMATFCCPSVLQCCIGHPGMTDGTILLDDLDYFEAIDWEGLKSMSPYDSSVNFMYGFCGMAIGSNDCAVDMMVPHVWNELDTFNDVLHS